MESIFRGRVLDALTSNANKPSTPVEDDSVYQFSDAITDKELDEHIKRMGGKSDETAGYSIHQP